MPNENHPLILYWFITRPILEKQQYLKDLDYIASRPRSTCITPRTVVMKFGS